MQQLLRACLLLFVIDAETYGQSLGDIAKREEERRRSVAGSGRVYTNQDLPEPSSSASTPADTPKPGAETKVQKEPVKSDVTDPKTDLAVGDAENRRVPNPKRDETYWRERTRTYRNIVTKLQSDIAALESRLEMLRAAQQTPVIASEIRSVDKDLTRFRTDLQSAERDLTRIEKHARDAGAAAWIE